MPPAGSLSGALAPETAARLQAALARGLAASPGVRSIAVAVAAPGQGRWSGGRSAPDDPPDALPYWASAGKMFTAVVVLQLAEEGKLSLGDPVSRWIPGVPNGDVVTIEHLLAHTSGLFSVNEDLQVRRRGGPLTLEETVRVAAKHGAMSCPGERWRYSNTGYMLLGDVIARVDGRSYADAVRARIVAPLGLRRTRVLAPGESVAGVVPPRSGKLSEPSQDLAEPGPAGPIAASPDDMVAFLQALLGGGLLRRPGADLMAQLYPMFDAGTFYGQGLMVYDAPDQDGRLFWIGHSGGAPGVNAIVVWSPRDQAFAAVSLSGEGASAAFANALLKALAVPPNPAP
ncbi:serine hydrolase [Phenylobacterium sp. LjRoot225]|uniref:serine hydrolase domain-containing protein n=1 Tax=Phenylobacterium sp. LjRoot225 TaxID=3342285 RepID=UPI003ECD0BCC